MDNLKPKLSKKRVKEYHAALTLISDKHAIAAFGHDYMRNNRRYDVIDCYILDTFGNRYMVTHFPEFSKNGDIIKPFVDQAEEDKCREESETRLSKGCE
jgi:hypothetical protein